MTYLATAACALALLLGSSAGEAEAKGGPASKNAVAGPVKSSSAVIQRDHRVPYSRSTGGVTIFSACKRGTICDHRHPPHNH